MNRKRRAPALPNLKVWREGQGLSSTAAAAKLGMSQAKYLKLEHRTRFLRGPEAAVIRDETGVPLEVLVGAD